MVFFFFNSGTVVMFIPDCLVVKNLPAMQETTCSAGGPGSIPGLRRSPGEGNGNPVQYSCLENPMDIEAWWATVHWVAESRIRLSDCTFIFSVDPALQAEFLPSEPPGKP